MPPEHWCSNCHKVLVPLGIGANYFLIRPYFLCWQVFFYPNFRQKGSSASPPLSAIFLLELFLIIILYLICLFQVQDTEIEVSLNLFRSEKQYQHRILWKMLMKRVVSSFIPSLGFSSLSPSIVKSGDVLKQVRIFSSSDVLEYSKLSHDLNPLHFDIESARNAGFEDRLVHGMLVASLFPRIIASHFPGAVYVSQSLQFRSPVYIGEEVIGEVQATNIREIKNKYIAKFKTKCFKHGDHLVVEGEATAILPTLAMEQGQSTG